MHAFALGWQAPEMHWTQQAIADNAIKQRVDDPIYVAGRLCHCLGPRLEKTWPVHPPDVQADLHCTLVPDITLQRILHGDAGPLSYKMRLVIAIVLHDRGHPIPADLLPAYNLYMYHNHFYSDSDTDED